MKLSKKKQRSNKIKSIVIAIIALVLILVLAYTFIAHAKGVWPFSKTVPATTQTTAITPPTQQDNSNAKSAAQTAGTTTDQIPVNNTLTARIDSVAQNGSTVDFAGSVINTSAAGSCSVTYSTPNDQPISKTSSATLSGTTATCDPISISAAQFSYLGDWTVTFRYIVNNTQAVATGNVTIH